MPAAGLPPTNYDPAYGGIPQVPDPNATAANAVSGNLADWGNIANLGGQFNAFQNSQSILPYLMNLPNYAGMMGQQSGVIGSELAGEIPQDVRNLLTQQAAERGVQTGSIGSPNANAALLRAMGLTSIGLQQQGMGDLQRAIGEIPRPDLFNPNTMMVTPEQAQANALLESIFRSAPVPSAAAAAAEEAVRRNMDRYRDLYGDLIDRANRGLGRTDSGGLTPPIRGGLGGGYVGASNQTTPPFYGALGGGPPGVFGYTGPAYGTTGTTTNNTLPWGNVYGSGPTTSSTNRSPFMDLDTLLTSGGGVTPGSSGWYGSTFGGGSQPGRYPGDTSGANVQDLISRFTLGGPGTFGGISNSSLSPGLGLDSSYWTWDPSIGDYVSRAGDIYGRQGVTYWDLMGSTVGGGGSNDMTDDEWNYLTYPSAPEPWANNTGDRSWLMNDWSPTGGSNSGGSSPIDYGDFSGLLGGYSAPSNNYSMWPSGTGSNSSLDDPYMNDPYGWMNDDEWDYFFSGQDSAPMQNEDWYYSDWGF